VPSKKGHRFSGESGYVTFDVVEDHEGRTVLLAAQFAIPEPERQ
jgi:hypothetical protein